MKYLYICIGLIFLGCNSSKFGTIPDYVTSNKPSYIEEIQNKISSSFDKAEKEIFAQKPKPNIDITIDPDPAKCICKGTGIIVQGDDHKTPCPYHAKQKQPVPIFKK